MTPELRITVLMENTAREGLEVGHELGVVLLPRLDPVL